MQSKHPTPRMGNRPFDPAYELLTDDFKSTPVVHRSGCYICEDMEYARMGLPLCSPCCKCAAQGKSGHIPADDSVCEDCGHEQCADCFKVDPQANICTCDTPCCEVDVIEGYPPYTCGSQHCPTHGTGE
jgi:hypothetical protein